MEIKKICIVTRDQLDESKLELVKRVLKSYNAQFDHTNVCDIEKNKFYKDADIILSVGGDGTLLSAAKSASITNKPVMGINMGHLGFLTALEIEETELLKCLFLNEFDIDERMMLECEYHTGDTVYKDYCLNDVIISRGIYPRMIKSKILISGSTAEEYTADGIIVSTPTGSTAYALSAGGPIVSPVLDVMTVTPICPHSLYNRSLVVSGEEEIEIESNESYNPAVFVSCDGRESIETDGVIKIKKSTYTTKLIRIKKDSFYSILRKKMSERSVK